MRRSQTITPRPSSPSDFREKFTIFLDTEGCPVQRALHEMTATEVLTAIEWHTEEALRLQEKTTFCIEMAEAAETGVLHLDLPEHARRVAGDGAAAAATALGKASRLLALVVSALPKHGEHLPLRERILSTWPVQPPDSSNQFRASRV